MILFDPEGSLTILDENKFSTIFFVIVNSLTFCSEGKVYIMSSISSSIIDLDALAPVFLLYASFAIASQNQAQMIIQHYPYLAKF